MSKKKVYWALQKAIEEAKACGIEVSLPTLIKWCKPPLNLGFQLGGNGGKWYVYSEKFMRYINGGKITQAENEKSGIAFGARVGEYQQQTIIGTDVGQVRKEG